MRQADVKIGAVYNAKVSGKIVPVRVDSEWGSRGYYVTNLATGRELKFKTAAKLRAAV